MSYQKTTGPLMANSHPGSYCGQDAYCDMFVTESKNEDIFVSKVRAVQGIRTSIEPKDARLQRCNRFGNRGGATRWILKLKQWSGV